MARMLTLSPGTARTAVGLALWGGAAYGVLGLARLPGDGGARGLCGPWGCLPPLQSLAAAHGFWLLVIGPAVARAAHRLSPRGLRRLGGVLLAIGGAGLAWVAVGSMATAGAGPPGWRPILHAVFEVAMLVDVPLVELVAAGLACLVIATRGSGRGTVDRTEQARGGPR